MSRGPKLGTAVPPAHRTIGVALSGGGAAALAQVGVLEELAAAGIRPGCVAGTSAGAMVGAAYAADHLAEFRAAMCALTRRRVLWLFDPKWPRTGLFEGRHAMDLIRPFVGRHIETLARPFAAVATDLTSGAEIVLRSGDVVEAIRASIAVPGIFTPRRRDGRLLVDGGLVNPIPVSVARELDADFVIAVSVLPLSAGAWRGTARDARERRRLATQLLTRLLASIDGKQRAAEGETAPGRRAPATESEIGLVEVLSQASRIVGSHIAAARLREQPPDFLLSIPLVKIGIFDFHRSPEIIEAGRAATRRALPEIRAALARALPLSRRVRRWLHVGGAAERRGRP